MADYWKSQPRKFCKVCKCWFGDNKASIDFHERGQRHKNNVARQLRESRERSTNKLAEAEHLSKRLDDIEKAALFSYEKDLAKDPTLTTKDSSFSWTQLQRRKRELEKEVNDKQDQKDRRQAALTASAIARAHASLPLPNEPKEEKPSSKKPPPPPNEWSTLSTTEGQTYYYNNITGRSQWEVPSDLQTSPQHPQGSDAPNARKRAVQVQPPTDEVVAKRGSPFGAWTTVEDPNPKIPSLAKVVKPREHSSSDDEEEIPPKHLFREKALPTLSLQADDSEVDFKAFSFKKRNKISKSKRTEFSEQ